MMEKSRLVVLTAACIFPQKQEGALHFLDKRCHLLSVMDTFATCSLYMLIC